jgi:hypothetical protein
VKGDHDKVSHVQLVEVLLQTGNGGSGIKVHPQMIKVDISRQTEGLAVSGRDVVGVSTLSNVHERVNIGVRGRGAR